MSRVVHFEIVTPQPEKAVEFYKDVFGWEFQKWEDVDYWLATTGPEGQPGINGAVMPGDEPKTVNTIDVSNVDELIDRITKAGGKVVQPKTEVSGQGYVAYCADPGGAVFGIFESSQPQAATAGTSAAGAETSTGQPS